MTTGQMIVVDRINMALTDCGLAPMAFPTNPETGCGVSGWDDGRVTPEQYTKAFALVMFSAGRTSRNVRCSAHVRREQRGLCEYVTPSEALMGRTCAATRYPEVREMLAIAGVLRE